jgi:AcrR family transcriptional regulator
MNEQKQHIIKTAGELFFRLGIRSVSIDDICREMGMSKKTFYVYFESKDALIEQMLQANLAYIEGKMKEILELNDFRQIVKRFLKRQAEEKNDVRRVPQLVYDLKKYYPRQFAEFQQQCFELHQHYIEQYLELGISQGLVRANLIIKITALIFARIYSSAIRDFEELEAQNHNMHQLGYATMDILVRGILSEEGLKLYEN